MASTEYKFVGILKEGNFTEGLLNRSMLNKDFSFTAYVDGISVLRYILCFDWAEKYLGMILSHMKENNERIPSDCLERLLSEHMSVLCTFIAILPTKEEMVDTKSLLQLLLERRILTNLNIIYALVAWCLVKYPNYTGYGFVFNYDILTSMPYTLLENVLKHLGYKGGENHEIDEMVRDRYAERYAILCATSVFEDNTESQQNPKKRFLKKCWSNGKCKNTECAFYHRLKKNANTLE